METDSKTKQQREYSVVYHENGHIEWSLRTPSGYILHREDGPAVIHPGERVWYMEHGKNHRMDGPAVESTCGRKDYYVNGELHRIDGPAIVSCDNGKLCENCKYIDMEEIWYIGGKLYSSREYDKKIGGLLDHLIKGYSIPLFGERYKLVKEERNNAHS